LYSVSIFLLHKQASS